MKKGITKFLIKPVGKRYNNTKKVAGKKIIINTEMQNHNFVNREAEIVSVPLIGDDLGLKKGDVILVHHNIFRRMRDIYGKEKNSRSFINDDLYQCSHDQIYMVKRDGQWVSLPGFTFVMPVQYEGFFGDKEHKYFGIVEYEDPTEEIVKKGDLVTFLPNSEFEFIVDNKNLYRILSKYITTKDENSGDKKAYHKKWVRGS
jgi:hypothetical protein